MGRARFTPEQIIRKLCEAELLLGHVMNIGEDIRKLSVSEVVNEFTFLNMYPLLTTMNAVDQLKARDNSCH